MRSREEIEIDIAEVTNPGFIDECVRQQRITNELLLDIREALVGKIETKLDSDVQEW